MRAVSRNPQSKAARTLSQLGAEVVQADMDDRASLEAAFDGMRHVFSVQNWNTSGTEGEIRQGKLVAEVARWAGVDHLVYGSAGTGEPDTGIAHFESKIEVENHMRQLGLPFSIIRPGPFMELLSEKEFFPAMATWGTEPKITGWDLPLPWVAVRDLGVAIAEMFQEPGRWIGQDVAMFGDVKALAECQETFVAITGKKPLRIPLPLWMFHRMAGNEFTLMWQWMVEWIGQNGVHTLWEIVESSRQLSPDLLDMKSWLTMKQKGTLANPAPAVQSIAS